MFYGKGAGKLATASAVVADMLDSIEHKDNRRRIFWGDGSKNLLRPLVDALCTLIDQVALVLRDILTVFIRNINMIVLCEVNHVVQLERNADAIVEDCAIPQTRGLGSSSACTVAGIMGANMLLGEPLDRNAVIDLAATIEGHPDNSTPAILGGFCVALLENGHVSHVRVPVHGAIDFVVFIPDFQLSTEKTHTNYVSSLYTRTRALIRPLYSRFTVAPTSSQRSWTAFQCG
mgnify:CR=1 FL=1